MDAAPDDRCLLEGGDGDDGRKGRELEGFGDRLTEIRRSRGLTQVELGEAVGVSNRVIAYYENESDQPPGTLLVDLARTLEVTTDELLGMEPFKERKDPKKPASSDGYGRSKTSQKPTNEPC